MIRSDLVGQLGLTGGRQISTWVYLLLAIALAYVVIAVAQARVFTLGTAGYFAMSAAPAVVGAAMLFVAPRARLARFAAVAFVAPVVVAGVRYFFAGDRYLLPGYPSDAYLNFAAMIGDAARLLSDFLFIFELGAVIAVALLLGRVQARRGWLVVALCAALAVAQASLMLLNWPAEAPIDQLPLWLLAQTTVVAWGYLLAVALERNLRLFSIGAALMIVQTPLNILSATLPAGPGDPLLAVYFVTFWLTAPVAWIALIAAVLVELPGAHARSFERRSP